jgi:hypothetical protein
VTEARISKQTRVSQLNNSSVLSPGSDGRTNGIRVGVEGNFKLSRLKGFLGSWVPVEAPADRVVTGLAPGKSFLRNGGPATQFCYLYVTVSFASSPQPPEDPARQCTWTIHDVGRWGKQRPSRSC